MAYERSLPDDPVEDKNVFEIAFAYLSAGLSLIPIKPDGSKAPFSSLLPGHAWKPYQGQLPSHQELIDWFTPSTGAGIGIIGGHISGNLEIIDFDQLDLYEFWRDLIRDVAPDLLKKLTLLIGTPKPGRHVPYRCDRIEGNQKLAENRDHKTLIETRGDGGYVVAPGSPLACHPSGRPYEVLKGRFEDIPTITPDERQILLSTARSFNERPQKTVYQSQGTTPVNGDRPGDLYNARVRWDELMPSMGATATGRRGEAILWKRPGKTTPGHSAITGNGDDLLYVFSSNFAPFEPDTAYDRFGAYTTWFHGGDFSAAAKELFRQGYGRNGTEPSHVSDEEEPPYHSSEVCDEHQEEPPTRPLIRLNTDMTGVVNKLQTAIRQLPKGPYLYQRAHQLSIIARGIKPPKWLRRPPDAPIIHPASPAYIRELAAYAADWEKFDERSQKWKATLPPPWTIDTLIARPSWTFPPLEGIICAPTIRPDGSILATPGYDPDTGLYLSIDQDTFPPILERPTIDDARQALRQLEEVYIDFPFSADHDKAAAVSAILSMVARFAVQGRVPLFAVRSTTRGSGKGLLIDTISMIATGRHAPRWPQTLDEEEERKRLLTVAMAGDPLIHIDNVTHPLGSAPLDMVLTAETITDRILGQHAQREAPLHAVFFASGNNMVFRGDMARRVLPIDLAPTMERPEERETFTHTPLLDWVLKQRPTLVCAALTLLKAYFVANAPKQSVKPFGSFEAWSNLIRQSLVWTDGQDPCEGRTNIEAESDPDYEQHHAMLCAWHDRYGTEPKTVKAIKADIENHMVKDAETDRWIIAPAWRDLHESLIALDKRGREIDVRAIGYALRSWQGRVVAGKQLIKLENDRLGIAGWCVRSL